jgi:hypothetical protein
MTRRAPRWLLQGSSLHLRPAAAADLPRLAAFLARRDLVRSPLALHLLPEDRVPVSAARPDPLRRPLALVAEDVFGAPAGLFALGPAAGRDLELAFVVPAGEERDLREGLRLVLAAARRRTRAERAAVGETGRTPRLDAILVGVGFRREPGVGWIYTLIEGPRVPMRIVRAH